MDAIQTKQAFDLVVLDVMLPGEDGFRIWRRLRATSTIPIVMPTALGDEINRIVGIELGADDYITKPFHPRELMARIKGLLRRASYGAEQPLQQAEFQYPTASLGRPFEPGGIIVRDGTTVMALYAVRHRCTIQSES